MFTGRHRAVDQCVHQAAVHVVDTEVCLSGVLQAEVDGRRRVEGVGVVLLQAEACRLLGRRVDVGGAFQCHGFDPHVLQTLGQLEVGCTVVRPGRALPGRTVGQIAEDGNCETVGVHRQLVVVHRQLVGCWLNSGASAVAVGCGTDQFTDAQVRDQRIVRIVEPGVDQVAVQQGRLTEQDHCTTDVDAFSGVAPVIVKPRRKTIQL